MIVILFFLPHRLRKRHGCEALAYDSQLAKSAQLYADKLAKWNQMKHSNGQDYGENLAARSSSAAVDMTGERFYCLVLLYSSIETLTSLCFENVL